VKQALPAPSWFQKRFRFHCNDCGSETAFRSRPRTFGERYLLRMFLLQPVRCSECFRREYRLIFVPAKPRVTELVRRMEAKDQGPRSNVA
jgi:hypothetical protein